jgi:hypothetical protein
VTWRRQTEGLARQVRKGIEQQRHHDETRVERDVADIVDVVRAAESLNLRTAAIDLTAHQSLVSLLESKMEVPQGRQARRRRKDASRVPAQFPQAERSGQLTLPFEAKNKQPHR